MAEIDQTPDPNNEGGKITVDTSGVISSVISSATSSLNLNLPFDPTVILNNAGQQQAFGPSSAAGNAPLGSGNSTNIQLQVTQRTDDSIRNNVLNNYIDVIYNISLGLVSQAASTNIQQDTSQKEDIKPSDYVIFASTADAKTNTTAQQSGTSYVGNYYNIQSLSFRSIVGHQPQNPLVAISLDGKMKLYEPYGFQLREDLIDIARQLGYSGTISPMNFVYRLEIWFSGWNPKTGEWISRIGIPNPQPNNSGNIIPSVVYYLLVTTIDAKVTPSGTFYDLSFQTHSHYAFRSEFIFLHKDTFGTKVEGKQGETFSAFLTNLAQKMTDQIAFDTQNKFTIIYKFTGLKPLMESTFVQYTEIDFSGGVSYNSGDGGYIVAANNIDMLTLLHQAMINLTTFRALLLKEDDKQFLEPTVLWNIRTNTPQVTRPDDQTNCDTQYIFEYIFEPVLTYRSRMSELPDRNAIVEPANQASRAQNMANYGMIYRYYDYYFTSDNTEIIDLQLKYKMFYYQQIPYPGKEAYPRGMQQNSPDSVVDKNFADKAVSSQGTDTRTIYKSNLTFSVPSSPNFNQLLVIAAPPQSSDGTRTYADKFQGRNRPIGVKYNPGHNARAVETNKTLSALDDYSRNDMISADMAIRFDPIWLLNPYMAGGDSTSTIPLDNTTDGAGGQIHVYAHTDRLIYINAFAPNQQSFMNPDASLYNIRKTPVLVGWYQVISIDNEFDGGKFIQKLNMVKNQYQNYPGSAGSIQSGDHTNVPPGGSSLPPGSNSGVNGGTSGAVDPSVTTDQIVLQGGT